MSIVRKGIKGASLIAGGIAVSQQADIEKNINTLTKVTGARIIQSHVQHEQSMTGQQKIGQRQEQLLDVTYEGFGMLAKGMNSGFNYIGGQMNAGFDQLGRQVDEVQNSVQIAAVAMVKELGRVDENNARRTREINEQIQATENSIVEAANEMQIAIVKKLKESIDSQNLQNRMTASPAGVKAEERVEKGAKFIIAHKTHKVKDLDYLRQALEQYEKALSKDPFNVDALYYSSFLKNKLGLPGWSEGYKDLFNKIKVELNETNERYARAKKIAYKASVSCPVDLIDAVETKLVIDFYPFAKEQVREEASLLLRLDAIKQAALFLKKSNDEKITVRVTKTGQNWFDTCAKKWGTNKFYSEILQISSLMEVPATQCYNSYLERFNSQKFSIINNISSKIKSFKTE